jgi:Rieske 2Fe-2S family protein
MSASLQPKSPYNGLTEARGTLPAGDYYTQDAYERDLAAIWYRDWVCIGRGSEIAEPLAFRVVRIGDQEVLVVRDENGVVQAYHNTCRHRGSALKTEECGRLKARLITCPYHAWSYSLRGDLVRVPSKSLPAGFDRKDHSLYRVAVAEWGGFIFVNLAAEPATSLEGSFDPASGDLSNWPLADLVVGHSYRKEMACNWKIFWENFNECLHCPGVHPELSALVPIYGRGLMARHDDPDWETHANDDAPEYAGTLREGAETWSMDGQALNYRFPDLSAAERKAGQTYAMNLPSMFVVGHVDYVRTVRLMPLGPERTELAAEWLFTPEALKEKERIEAIVGFGSLVLKQDADICEVNQRGLRSARHEAGVLMPEEYDIARFHDWVAARTAAL